MQGLCPAYWAAHGSSMVPLGVLQIPRTGLIKTESWVCDCRGAAKAGLESSKIDRDQSIW